MVLLTRSSYFLWLALLSLGHLVYGKLSLADGGALVGISVKDGQLNIVRMDPQTLALSLLYRNVTAVESKGITPEFSTAYCSDTGNYMVAINDMSAPRVVGVDLKTGKVIGVIKVNGIYVKNLECDTKTGFGMAYVFLLGYKHDVVQLDFVAETHTILMSSSYKSYGGSAIDPGTGRLFTVSVIPHFDAFNYSLNTMEYRALKEIITPPFKGYSIGDILFDSKLGQPLAVVQTPPEIEEGPNYQSMLAMLDVCKGTVKPLAEPWPGQQPIRNTGLAFDPDARVAYVFLEKTVRAVKVDEGTILYVKSTESIPWPVLHYEWVA